MTNAHHIHAMRQFVEHMLESQKRSTSVKQGKAKVQATKLFSPFELVNAAYLTKLEKEQKAKIKQEASEQKKEAKLAKRATRTTNNQLSHCMMTTNTTIIRKNKQTNNNNTHKQKIIKKTINHQ